MLRGGGPRRTRLKGARLKGAVVVRRPFRQSPLVIGGLLGADKTEASSGVPGTELIQIGFAGDVRLAKPRRYAVADLDDRLVRCISSAFPGLPDREIRTADVERLAAVDSLAAVTLVALIDQEFGVDLELEGLLKFGSFAELCQYLREQLASSEAVDMRRVN